MNNIYLALILIILLIYVFSYREHKLEMMSNLTLDNHLKFIVSLFDLAGVKYWLMYDTLLSAVVTHTIYPTSTSVHIGAYVDDLNYIMFMNDILSKFGYTLIKNNLAGKTQAYGNGSIQISYDNNVICNIYLYGEYGDIIEKKSKKNPFPSITKQDGYMRLQDVYNNTVFLPNEVFHSVFINKLSTNKINDVDYNIPSGLNHVFLLKYWYGSSWMNITSNPTFFVWKPTYFKDNFIGHAVKMGSKNVKQQSWNDKYKFTKGTSPHTVDPDVFNDVVGPM